jgi:hypothetical protein
MRILPHIPDSDISTIESKYNTFMIYFVNGDCLAFGAPDSCIITTNFNINMVTKKLHIAKRKQTNQRKIELYIEGLTSPVIISFTGNFMNIVFHRNGDDDIDMDVIYRSRISPLRDE